MKQATAQDTFDHVLESGFLTFPWWTRLTVTGRDAPGWAAVAVSADPDDPADKTRATVSHQVLLRAARQVLKAPPRYMSQDCVRQCRNLLFSVDECDFDACSGDQLMQFVVLGRDHLRIRQAIPHGAGGEDGNPRPFAGSRPRPRRPALPGRPRRSRARRKRPARAIPDYIFLSAA